ncbi:MAG: hypothetical protein JOZ17_09195 [Acetobacteraceae bacterium]|nr:hypothetical protein [Acetobacteraceae bacterium]
MTPKFSTTLRGLAAVLSAFSKKIAELGPPMIDPRLIMVLPDPFGLMGSDRGSTPLAMTEAPFSIVTVELSLNSIVFLPSCHRP